LSDVIEYVSVDEYHRMLDRIARTGKPGARLAYWNMLAPRRRPETMADRLASRDELARRLHEHDRAFFYSAFVVEEVL
jgi:S-adenosylmethionine-diacylglycerol 3-amino-3-carboxypropyl transferase